MSAARSLTWTAATTARGERIMQQEPTQQEHSWQQVRDQRYRTLGKRLAALEAIERGEYVAAPEVPPTPGAEPSTTGEQIATLRAQMLMVMRSLQASLQAVLDCRPQVGEDCVLVEVARVAGWGPEVEADERARWAEKARLN
jgi:hypothetical protein